MGSAGQDLRLVATDIDGTIASGYPPATSQRTAAALQHLAEIGIPLVLVTARPPRSVRPIAQQLGGHGLVICANGALLYDPATDVVVRHHSLAPDTARQIVEALRRELPDLAFAVEAGVRFGHEPAFVPAEPSPADTLIAEVEELIVAPVAKLLARHPSCDTETLVEIASHLVGDLAPVHNSGGERLLEFSAPGVSKAMALEHLADGLRVPPEAVLAFGDMPNDIPMLAWAGRGVAVANAHPDVLAMADDVCGPCDGDGVAHYLSELLRA
ncbi:MAG: HAD family hydrolase [Acidimicrobiales bacterium]